MRAEKRKPVKSESKTKAEGVGIPRSLWGFIRSNLWVGIGPFSGGIAHSAGRWEKRKQVLLNLSKAFGGVCCEILVYSPVM